MPKIELVEVVIGLFGTCDNIRWRDKFMEAYDQRGIKYFNPMIDDWTERLEMSRKGLCPNPTEEENFYLNNAQIILFPVLAESLGSGSLGELGFSVNAVLRNILNGRNQQLIALIDDNCTDMRKSEEERKRSVKDRALVKSKLKKYVSFPQIVLVNSLTEMFDLSIDFVNFLSKHKDYLNLDSVAKTA